MQKQTGTISGLYNAVKHNIIVIPARHGTESDKLKYTSNYHLTQSLP